MRLTIIAPILLKTRKANMVGNAGRDNPAQAANAPISPKRMSVCLQGIGNGSFIA
jgi:hypothetical protein